MPDLREHFQRALDREMPTEAEAKRDLARLLARVDGSSPSPAWAWGLRVAAAGAVAASVAFVVFAARRDVRPTNAPDRFAEAPARAPASVEIYVRRSDEPESSALAVSLQLEGDRHP
jgi:predicted membrane-bound mannosyltransferase